MSKTGTPESLKQAIENGYGKAQTARKKPGYLGAGAVIVPHVRDFLAQKFGAAMLSAPSKDEESRLSDLWKAIVGDGTILGKGDV